MKKLKQSENIQKTNSNISHFKDSEHYFIKNRQIKAGLQRLLKDVYSLRFAVLGLAVYYVTVHFLFGQFCPLMILLHIPCPGCGMTRALILVLSGQWKLAWQLQPLIYGWILLGIGFVTERYILNRKTTVLKAFLLLLLVATLALYGYRVINGFPNWNLF